jgi:cytochrome c oxidase cbb3-type subunit 3
MKNNFSKLFFTAFAVLLPVAQMFAQDNAASSGDSGFFTQLFADTTLIATAVLTLSAIIAITQLLNSVVRAQQLKTYKEQGLEAFTEEAITEEGSAWDRLIKRWTKAVPVTKEADVLLDHDYDGIRELDNSLPPWWVAMFYVTIAFALVYMAYYHFGGEGPSSSEEYEYQMAKAEEAKEAFLAKQANKVDETNVTVMTGGNELAIGKTIYEANCVACHGAGGEGGVGPNMTDDYWIHGGSIKDIFKTIKNGVPEKGMIAWSTQLRPADMQRVASYIMTMRGTNPPNAKEPQGELYDPSAEAPKTTEDSAGQASSAEGQ